MAKKKETKPALITGKDTPATDTYKVPTLKGKLLYNAIAVTTRTKGKHSLIETINKEGSVMPIQKVVAVGPLVKEVKVGDAVLVDWSGFERSKVQPVMLSVKDGNDETEPVALVTDRLIHYVFAEGEQDKV
ncbi:MAG: hypothetical protein N4A76_00985 [Firmicutes bacterium]|jgi:hypothetical protein|nr:hypothetical protein [Bacillota bacterium]